MDRLPPELLVMILKTALPSLLFSSAALVPSPPSLVDLKDAREFALVSKAWYNVLEPVLAANVVLNGTASIQAGAYEAKRNRWKSAEVVALSVKLSSWTLYYVSKPPTEVFPHLKGLSIPWENLPYKLPYWASQCSQPLPPHLLLEPSDTAIYDLSRAEQRIPHEPHWSTRVLGTDMLDFYPSDMLLAPHTSLYLTDLLEPDSLEVVLGALEKAADSGGGALETIHLPGRGKTPRDVRLLVQAYADKVGAKVEYEELAEGEGRSRIPGSFLDKVFA
ncbi:hypothetical protein JCM8097_000467 [Rhodosporidiobolus ruineniae]